MRWNGVAHIFNDVGGWVEVLGSVLWDFNRERYTIIDLELLRRSIDNSNSFNNQWFHWLLSFLRLF